jgi:hypothetical protein
MNAIHDLRQIFEIPKLYLANYFLNLRNELDKEVYSNLINLEEDDKTKLDEIWKEIILKINLHENKCMENSINDIETISETLNSLELNLNRQDQTYNDLNEIKQQIDTIDYEIMKQLFLNKTIAFIPIGQQYFEYFLINLDLQIINDVHFKNIKGDFVGEGYTGLINSKLNIILNDDHLRNKSILKR